MERKGIARNESQTPFTHEQGAIVQFDWLLACQSKYDIRNLSFMQPHPEHNKIKIDMAESEEVFVGVFEFSVQETWNDLSENGNSSFLRVL